MTMELESTVLYNERDEDCRHKRFKYLLDDGVKCTFISCAHLHLAHNS